MANAPIKNTSPKMPDNHRVTEQSRPKIDGYYKSVSGKFRIAKYFTVITLIIFLVFSFTFLRKDITLENLRYLLKFISFTNTETSITASKINYASGDPNRLELFIGDLCTLSPEGYALYDSRGNQIMAEDIAYSSPVLKVSERFSLAYDMNGTSYTLFNTFSKLHEGMTEYPITDADIADDGSFVVASSSREYRTAITVYNDEFKALANIYKNDHLMALELSDDGRLLALMTSTVSEGTFVTNVELIVPGEDSSKRNCSLEGLGYSFFFLDDGYAAVTDQGICFLDMNLEPIRVYSHTAQPLMSYSSGKYIVSVYPEGIIGNSCSAVILDMYGTKLYDGVFSGKLVGIDSLKDSDCIFILTGTTLTRIDLLTKRIAQIEVGKDAIDILVSTGSSVLVGFKNYALTYDLTTAEDHYYDRPNTEAETLPTQETGSPETKASEASEATEAQAETHDEANAETVNEEAGEIATETEAVTDDKAASVADTEQALR